MAMTQPIDSLEPPSSLSKRLMSLQLQRISFISNCTLGPKSSRCVLPSDWQWYEPSLVKNTQFKDPYFHWGNPSCRRTTRLWYQEIIQRHSLWQLSRIYCSYCEKIVPFVLRPFLPLLSKQWTQAIWTLPTRTTSTTGASHLMLPKSGRLMNSH